MDQDLDPRFVDSDHDSAWLSVSLSARLLKKLWMDSDEIFSMTGAWPKKRWNTFWCWSDRDLNPWFLVWTLWVFLANILSMFTLFILVWISDKDDGWRPMNVTYKQPINAIYWCIFTIQPSLSISGKTYKALHREAGDRNRWQKRMS